MLLPPVARRILEVRGEESAETPPPWVDLVLHSRALHGLGTRAEHLHRYLARQGVLSVTRQVERPVLHRKFLVVRAWQELRFAELDAQLGGLQRAVARRAHHHADPQI